jgi:hypothetical protein
MKPILRLTEFSNPTGWRALLSAHEDEPICAAVFYPECAWREFGPPCRRTPLAGRRVDHATPKKNPHAQP